MSADGLIPTRIVVDRRSWDDIVAAMERPGEPTPAMRELMSSNPPESEPRARNSRER